MKKAEKEEAFNKFYDGDLNFVKETATFQQITVKSASEKMWKKFKRLVNLAFDAGVKVGEGAAKTTCTCEKKVPAKKPAEKKVAKKPETKKVAATKKK